MRTAATPTFAVLVPRALACFVLAGALPLAAAAPRIPQPVSPGATAQGAAVEARCPTFLWAGVPGARGYELAVFELSANGAEPRLVTRASVPGDARGFTPPSSDCLERGRRYAWSVTVTAADATPDELRWSSPFLFEIEAAPSRDELEQAIATIERYRAHGLDASALADRAPEPAVVPSPPVRMRQPRAPFDANATLPGALSAPTSGVIRVASAATPALGTPSLRVSANVALSAASNFFKNDEVFLWDEPAAGNTALGRNALAAVTTAVRNTAVGSEALASTTGGAVPLASYNTAIGDDALKSNTTGFANTASGSQALASNTTGSNNTASGDRALTSNTSGSRNTASGSRALGSNTTGIRNTASGARALFFNTTGDANTASGYQALYSNTTGLYNTASGARALYSNTTGSYNTASGRRALYFNDTGIGNTASGSQALASNTTGSNNTASGYGALSLNTFGAENTASGYQALVSSTRSRNTAVGVGAGSSATTGDDNIFVGSGATGVAMEGHTIRIGGTATGGLTPGPGEQNRTFINGIRGIVVANQVPVLIDSTTGQLGIATSSREVKQDIQDLGTLADRLLELRPVAFRYKQHAAADPETPLQFGLIAEEVAEVFPELVVFDQDGKPETVKYHLLSALLLGEVQRLHDRLETMEHQASARPKSNVERKHRAGNSG